MHLFWWMKNDQEKVHSFNHCNCYYFQIIPLIIGDEGFLETVFLIICYDHFFMYKIMNILIFILSTSNLVKTNTWKLKCNNCLLKPDEKDIMWKHKNRFERIHYQHLRKKKHLITIATKTCKIVDNQNNFMFQVYNLCSMADHHVCMVYITEVSLEMTCWSRGYHHNDLKPSS